MADIGFIVHRTYFYQNNQVYLAFIGRLQQGETFALLETREKPGFYLRASSAALTEMETITTDLKTLDGERVNRAEFSSLSDRDKQARALKGQGIRLYESDIGFHDSFLQHKGIRGQVAITGPWSPGQKVDRVYKNPQIEAAQDWPRLTYMAFDLETDPYGEEIWAFSALLKGDGVSQEGVWDSRDLGGERGLLEQFRTIMTLWDPDIITGWNIIDFDLPKLFLRMEKQGVPLDWGRSKEKARFFPGEGKMTPSYQIPGRQVVDALRAVRSGPETYEDYKLETVAQSVLGRGKEVSQSGEEKLAQLIQLRETRKESFLSYCLEDSRLVRDILEKTGLMELTIRRAALTGISLSKAWTSIQAFESLYSTELHKKGRVLPDYGVDGLPVGDSLGGAILSPKAGFYRNVLTFDFKSLYPTIIRTFNIDPLSFIPPAEYPKVFPLHQRSDFIETPGGQLFRRERAILPEVLTRFHQFREEAKEKGDSTASFVYKIIQNSIYGCLGSPQCRLAASDLAGAITGFGHYLLNWCRRWFQQEGFQVIYGDTDSVFVHAQENLTPEELHQLGNQLAARINGELTQHIKETYQVNSELELEFETIFARFFLPTLRHGEDLSVGRAKGYAGRPWVKEKSWKHGAMIIKGMEAVRRDWTRLARDFQIELLSLLFDDQPQSAFSQVIKELLLKLNQGELDHKCLYTKMLRKPVQDYTHNKPPHVQAAEHLPSKAQRGLIRYQITQDGPRPEGMGRLNYEHYVEKQLLPIAESIEGVLDFKISPFLDQTGQMDLFG